jgi:hypothetical protein
MPRSIAWVVLLSAFIGCSGPSVETNPIVELRPLPDDEPVYLFVREEELPACPWEVIGSVETRAGWLDRQGDRDAVSDAVRGMGGQAVLLGTRDDLVGEAIRFLEPYSICDPR